MKRTLGILVAGLLVVTAAPALADSSDLDAAVDLGAGYLVSIQGTYPGLMRVNPGPPGTVVSAAAIDSVWEWTIGTGQAYFNTWGPSAIGASHAAGERKLPDASAAVIAYADELVADFNDTGSFQRSQTRPQPSDIELLAALGGLGLRGCKQPRAARSVPAARSKAYRATAQAWFQNYPSAIDETDRVVDGRIAQGNGDLAGWDVALLIRAALAVRDDAYACVSATRVMDRAADWEGSSPAYISDYWHGSSEGGLAYALDLVDTARIAGCRGFSADVANYRAQLMARQSGPDLSPFTGIDVDGAIGVDFAGTIYHPTQHNAFALLGLVGCGNHMTMAERRAAEAVAGFLLRSQYPPGTGPAIAGDPRDADGAWPGFPYYWVDDSNGEVDGEVLYALATAHRLHLKPPTLTTLTSLGVFAYASEQRPPAGPPLVESYGRQAGGNGRRRGLR